MRTRPHASSARVAPLLAEPQPYRQPSTAINRSAERDCCGDKRDPLRYRSAMYRHAALDAPQG